MHICVRLKERRNQKVPRGIGLSCVAAVCYWVYLKACDSGCSLPVRRVTAGDGGADPDEALNVDILCVC